MNVASKELCKELYAVSGWYDTDHLWHIPGWKQDEVTHYDFNAAYVIVGDHSTVEDSYMPAYDLGYLLRKLPHKTRLEKFTIAGDPDKRRKMPPKDVFNCYLFTAREQHWNQADTPEDAAAKLCIELIKQKIIPSGGTA